MATSIGDDINTATRPHHTTLNRLILQHLPSALPPSNQTSSPHLYALGISHFLPIYSTFESLFHTHFQPCTLPSTTLQNLHTPALERAEALKSDLATLLPPEYQTPDYSISPRLSEFKQHIWRVLKEKPHLLVAYTWIFYMALFSGGRYIRGRLRDAFAAPFPTPLPANTNINNTDSPDSQTERDERAGLSFWDFPSDTDGEDLKLLYKSRIAILSPSLTPQEHVDIVNESVEIMIRLTDIVREVADTIPAKAAALEQDLREKVERSWNVDGDGDEMRGPMRMIRLPWILLLRYWFPWGAMDAVTRAVGTAVVPARVPAGHHAMGKGAPVPVPVRAR